MPPPASVVDDFFKTVNVSGADEGAFLALLEHLHGKRYTGRLLFALDFRGGRIQKGEFYTAPTVAVFTLSS